jgi:ribosome-binding factor A
MDEIRRRRVEEELRDLIAALIIGGEVKDPRVGPFVSVTRVEAARDLSAAKVFVSTIAAARDGAALLPDRDGEQDAALDRAVEGLQRAAGFIQAQLSRRMRTRLTPRLTFIPDRGIREGFELTERIKGLFT